MKEGTMMEDNGKLVENGHFRVFNDGTIHRIKNGIEKPITPTVFSTRCDKRLVTSCTENGKQKAFYVSRLVAEAYIHPLKKGQVVRYCDGNTLNVKASNLYIADQAEVRRQSGKKCKILCGSGTGTSVRVAANRQFLTIICAMTVL